MSLVEPSFTTVKILLPIVMAVVTLQVLVEGSCFVSTDGTALQGHVIGTLAEPDMLACYQRCKQEERCQSLNFYDNSSTCQINRITLAMKPWDSVRDRNAAYFENPFRVLIGSKKSVPALSCQEIKNASSTVASGRYWLYDVSPRGSVEVFCNMTKAVKEGCKRDPCQHGATCNYYGNGKYKCSCVAGYTGKHCDIDIDECSSNPCQNGGTCRDSVNGYICSCTPGYNGKHCQTFTPTECNTYRTISERNRHVSYGTNGLCDNGLTIAWYRFTGAAGTRMPRSCVAVSHCGASAPGWLNGGEPAPRNGIVSRQACFNWSGNCCRWSTNIRVRNCGSFFVYELRPHSQCSLRYCGA